MKLKIARISVALAAFACVAAFTVRTASAARPTPPFGGALPHRAVPATPAGTHALSLYQVDRLQQFTGVGAARRAPLLGDTLRVAVFQVQFTDSLMGGQPGSNRPQLRDSTWFANELGHVAEYYRGASRQRFHVKYTLDGRLYTLSHKMSYYGADANEDKRVVGLAAEVIAQTDDHIDFGQFDHVFIIHAGAGQETDVGGDSPGQIWSSLYDRSDIRRALDDQTAAGLATNDTRGGDPVFVDNFAVVPSSASQDFATVGTLGIWTYQIGGRIGLVPLFDSTPSGAPDSQGIGNFCLMGYGLFDVNGFVPSFPCAFNRALAGWLDPVVIDPGVSATNVRLADINTGSDADTVCIKIPITENEYYLVDNRVHDANFDSLFTFTDIDSDLIPDNKDSLEGAEFDFFLTDLTNPASRRYDPDYGFNVLRRVTGSGMYIWHIDERVVRDAVEQGFLPDDFVARKGVDLEEADGVQDMDRPGPAAFALGNYFDSFRAGDGNHAALGPDTKPNSSSNSGTRTGIDISTTSVPGPVMNVSIRRDVPYSEVRTRWAAASPGQPATPVDLDGNAAAEIVVLSDSAGVFVFNASGTEWNDADSNPATVAPFIPVPGITWTGPPAFANLDATPDIEIVATATSGEVFAWKANGSELVDGDSNPGTTGVLYKGLPMAAPPMLIDVDGGTPEVAITEHNGPALRLSLVSAAGNLVAPASPPTGWPVALEGQAATPLAEARVVEGTTTTTGIVAVTMDTTTAHTILHWVPVGYAGPAQGARVEEFHEVMSGSTGVSAPAVGDLDHDGDDEIVLTLASGDVFVFDPPAAPSNTMNRETGLLRSPHPSAPALGDVDGDGTLEIAVWDDTYMYLLKSNARPMVEWPRIIRPESAGEAPPSPTTRSFESPLFAGLNGGTPADAIFPLDDGTLAAFDAGGKPAAGFPRVGPAGMGGAPSIGQTAAGQWSLVAAGSNGGLAGVEAVTDSVATRDATTLSIQSLPGGVGSPFWTMARADLARTSRVVLTAPLVRESSAYDGSSFMIYPNPVMGDEVHARVDTNARATVGLSIYTLEGQEAFTRSFNVNPNGLANTPFDEAIDVHALKSGVYLLRLKIESSAGSGALVKTFAIRR